MWQVSGPRSAVIELGCRHTFHDIILYYHRHNVKLDRRVQTLTVKMLGDDQNHTLKTKAVETIALLPWALDLLRRYTGAIERATFLLQAGECLTEYLGILARSPRVISDMLWRKLLNLAIRHNQLARVAGVVMLPKHHIFIHLTIFIKHTGNPKYFANFLDESLNSILK